MAEKHNRDGGSNLESHPNFSNMFPSNFPEGMRVLVFDKDQDYLLELKQYLQGFQYEVTCCNDEERALSLLRSHRNEFDLALIDGDRFRLPSGIGSEIDLPFVIMSKDNSRESLMYWTTHGSCDYLMKPLRLEDLRLLFKNVAKMRVMRSLLAGEVGENPAVDWSTTSSVDPNIQNPNKRNRRIFPDEQLNEEDNHDLDRDHHDSPPKKRRVVWDEELHQKFVEAVEFFGPTKAVPMKILEFMNVKNISRANVASHLQKYRLSMAKNQPKTEDQMKPSLLTLQDGRLLGEEVPNFYEVVRNAQLSTHHINSIPQPSAQQHIMNPNYLPTHHMSPLRHHHDGIAISDGNLVMTHHHQVPDFNAGEILGYNNFNEDGPTDLASYLFTQNSDDVSLFHSDMEPTTMIPNDHHLSSTSFEMMNIPQTTPSSIFPLSHGTSSNQQENGVFDSNQDTRLHD